MRVWFPADQGHEMLFSQAQALLCQRDDIHVIQYENEPDKQKLSPRQEDLVVVCAPILRPEMVGVYAHGCRCVVLGQGLSPEQCEAYLSAGVRMLWQDLTNAQDVYQRLIALIRPRSLYTMEEHFGQVDPKKEKVAATLLHQLAVPPHLTGYRYLLDAVEMASRRPELLGAATKALYPAIAQRHGSTSARVERNMRHAIEVAWNRCRVETMEELFGYTIRPDKDKPTNCECIAMLAERVRMLTKLG